MCSRGRRSPDGRDGAAVPTRPERGSAGLSQIRQVRPLDRHSVVGLNQSAIPAVTPMTGAEFGFFVEVAERFLVVIDDGVGTGDVRGFMILLAPGATAYESQNYRWFSDRYAEFLYVDRIVVADPHRGTGLGRGFYDLAIDVAGSRPLLAEVNLRPRNEVSLAFHAAMGFEQVGSRQTDDGDKELAMLCREPVAT